jgi:hypothetical protein
MHKTPKRATRRRSIFDMLIATPDEWIEFDPKALGYPSPRCNALHSDLMALRDTYRLDIRAAGAGHPGICRWRYVPNSFSTN